MPENTATVDNATQGETAEKTFTQAEMDAIIGERLGRLKAKYADYDEMKAKAAKYDEAEEANKSELQKAVEERDALKAKLDKLEAEKAHADAVAKAAAEHGVDAELLSRMSGDVEENAEFLKKQSEGAPKYGAVYDSGESNPPSVNSTAQQFADAIDFF
jgi:chromosome segregation ATPase